MVETFSMIPAPARTLWTLGAVSLLLAVLLCVFAYLFYASQSVRFELSATDLRIHGDLWGRSLPLTSLVVERARVVDLAQDDAVRPRIRTFGTGLPGYRSGWFRLRNGEKALVYLTDTSQALYVPTREGYSLLLSPDEPERLLQRLRGS